MWPKYYPDFDLRNRARFEHQEHCIDILRQALMCSPDTTAAVWQWHEHEQQSMATWDTLHTCVDFTKIQEWAFSRALSEYNESIFVPGSPIYKPVYHGL